MLSGEVHTPLLSTKDDNDLLDLSTLTFQSHVLIDWIILAGADSSVGILGGALGLTVAYISSCVSQSLQGTWEWLSLRTDAERAPQREPFAGAPCTRGVE